MFKRLSEKWKLYKYRFVPWIALNLKDRTIRSVPSGASDDIIPKEEALVYLQQLFQSFEGVELNDANSIQHDHSADRRILSMMSELTGFAISRRKSGLDQGGTGVFVTSGTIPPKTVVALYAGTLYYNYEPILLQSISNPFIFRCIDGLLIDGNDKGISKYLYRSCSNRDRVGPYQMCDDTWLTPKPKNPLNIGQYVNNQSKKHPANVAYQEIDVPRNFPARLRKFIPNVFYGANIENTDEVRLTRIVALVSTRTIQTGEELFSTYFTVVY